MKPLSAALILFTGICACTQDSEFHWYDISGRGRSEDVAVADMHFCNKKEMPADWKSVSNAELHAASERVDSCMEQRGWRLK